MMAAYDRSTVSIRFPITRIFFLMRVVTMSGFIFHHCALAND